MAASDAACFVLLDAAAAFGAGTAQPVSKHVLLPAQMSRAPMPLLPVGDQSPATRAAHHAAHGPLPPLGFYVLRDGFVVGEGIVATADRRFYVADDLTSAAWVDRTRQALARAAADDFYLNFATGDDAGVAQRQLDDPAILLCRPGHQVYGHWLLDLWPSLWLLGRMAAAHPVLNRLPVLLARSTPGWARTILREQFGLADARMLFVDCIGARVRARTLIVPSLLRVEARLSPAMAGFAADMRALAAPLPPAADRRLFLTRRGVRSITPRQTANIDELEAQAREAGLAVIDPAGLPWLAQVALFRDAALIVGEFGSAMHNALFAGSGCRVLALGMQNGLQSGIAALRGQRIAYLAPAAQRETAASPELTFDVAAFRAALDAAQA